MGSKGLVFLWIGIIWTGLTFAQGRHPFIVNFSPKDYGESQPPENYDVILLKNGMVATANAGGILLFDGTNWSFLPAEPGIVVSSLTLHSDQKIYTAQYNHPGYFEKDQIGNWKYFSLKNKLPKKFREPGEINRVLSDGNHVVFQTEEVLLVWDGNQFLLNHPSHSFHYIVPFEEKIIARDRNKGLFEIRGKEKILWNDYELFKEYGVFGILPFKKDSALIVTMEAGLYVCGKNGNGTRLLKTFDELDGAYLYGGKLLPNGEYALNSLNKGILRLDRNAAIKYTIDHHSGLPIDEVKSIFPDTYGNIYSVGSMGVSFIREALPFDTYGKQEGLSGSIEDVVTWKNDLYVATSTGLFKSGENGFERIPGLIAHIFDLEATENKLLLAASNGIYGYSDQSIHLITRGIFNAIYYDQERSLVLAGGDEGLFLFNSQNMIIRSMNPDASGRYLEIQKDPSSSTTTYWAGIYHQGVIQIRVFHDNTLQVQWFDEMDLLNQDYPRPFKLENKLLFGTHKGVQIYEESEGQERGLFSDVQFMDSVYRHPVTGILEHDGEVFSVINNKIIRFKQKGERISHTYSTLNVGRINRITIQNEHLWICGTEKLIGEALQFNYPDLKNWKPFITSFNGSKDSLLAKYPEAVTTPIEIPYNLNSVSISFSAPFLGSEKPVQFIHRLIGHEEEWSRPGDETKVKYTNLHEGNYEFQLKGIDIYGRESEICSFSFSISPPWYRTIGAYIAYFVLFVLVVWSATRIASHRLKQQNIRLEGIVKERTQEIEEKNSELEHQNEQILHQQKEITDSISYAKRIQEAILPLTIEMKKDLPDSFILFKPKDIVSGDFYWYASKENKSIIVCSDCTGHGVPGAFMSMICTDKINHSVLEEGHLHPGTILSEVNIGIKKSLKQDDEENLTTKDGMDSAVCILDKEKMQLTYSGANRPLWLLRNNEILEFKPTKTAVGGFTREDQVFEEVIIPVFKGDRFYLSSDGFADQFGGEKGKKMMVKRFKDLLLSLADVPVKEQGEKLNKYFEDWRYPEGLHGDHYEQVDDVCVIGFSIS